jgi:hypothetical protein
MEGFAMPCPSLVVLSDRNRHSFSFHLGDEVVLVLKTSNGPPGERIPGRIAAGVYDPSLPGSSCCYDVETPNGCYIAVPENALERSRRST